MSMSDRAARCRQSIWLCAWREFGNDHCTLLAAAITYNVLFAFVPLVTFIAAMFGRIMRDPAASQSAADRFIQLLPLPNANDNLLLQLIRGVSAQTGTLTVIGVVGLMWSSAGIFGSIRSSLNIAWGVRDRKGFFLQFLFDVGSLITFGLLFAASMAGTVLLHAIETQLLRLPGIPAQATQNLILAGGLALPALISFSAFLFLYRFIPNVRHHWSDVWPGAMLAAVLFEASKHGFAFYVARFNHYQALYGALGGVMLFMLWTYVAGIILLIGAEVTAERERQRYHEEPKPEPRLREPDAPRETTTESLESRPA
jgi:membrane protein